MPCRAASSRPSDVSSSVVLFGRDLRHLVGTNGRAGRVGILGLVERALSDTESEPRAVLVLSPRAQRPAPRSRSRSVRLGLCPCLSWGA